MKPTIILALMAVLFASCSGGESEADKLRKSVNARMHFATDPRDQAGTGGEDELIELNRFITELEKLKTDLEKLSQLTDYKEDNFLKESTVSNSLNGYVQLRNVLGQNMRQTSY